MDKDNIKSTLTEYLVPLNYKLMLQKIQDLQLDKYVKKLDSVTTARLFIFVQLMQLESYADISLNVKTNKKLQKQSVWNPSVSLSFLESFEIWILLFWNPYFVMWSGKSLGVWVQVKPKEDGQHSSDRCFYHLALSVEISLSGLSENESRHQASPTVCL